MQRHLSKSARLSALIAGALGATFVATGDASAQVSGTSSQPLPDVLLLIDTSGSMERMVDGSTPEATPANTCSPGTYSNPNRWGMLVQALTGNIQPYYSCFSVDRTHGTDFATRYGIAGHAPYDTDYVFPYHQPVSGADAPSACVVEPWNLPGAPNGSGVGSTGMGAGGKATDYPTNALAQVLQSTIAAGSGIYRQGVSETSSTIPTANACTFSQNNDGQLDATKYYARFALMTFDNDTSGLTGLDTAGININTANPFTGQWSFVRTPGNTYYGTSSNDNILGAQGKPGTTPPCLTITPQEVGARNPGAPPWEGRLVNFPGPDATIYDMDTQNNQIQQTLIASRPSGATPLDGMMDDARDFYWNNPIGPNGTTADPYTCREKYIVILTDGAPNLDLRPSCAQTNGVCPYPDTAGTIANSMYQSTNAVQHVTTFVIGFAVSGTGETGGTGFPSGLTHNDCKTWFQAVAGGATDPYAQAQNMQNTCNTMRGNGSLVNGTTADACCKLNDVAIQGGHVGAFFAESQADIVLAFGRILANIIHSASTKTTPVFSPAISFSSPNASSGASTATSAEYIASYIPSSQRPWSGEIDRTRFLCDTSSNSVGQPEAQAKGDFESSNLAIQTTSASGNRIFITVIGDNPTNALDSQASIRPFANPGTPTSTGGDQLGMPSTAATTYKGREVAMDGYSTLDFVTASPTDWPLALNITKNTCQRGRAVHEGVGASAGTDVVPALDDPTVGAKECSDVVWGFTTAFPNAISYTGDPSSVGAYNFNVRCNNTANPTGGTCSISGTACVPGSTTSTCPTGEVCVENCAALGAIYHSTPAVVPPPQSLLREEGFRDYQASRAARTTALYVATTDGVLHAFKALDQTGPSANTELWAFVPPAVLPTLSSNYPAGDQILLDGAPVVRETVWDRVSGSTSDPKAWHSTLVAGLGTQGGYYAMNVTDTDCKGATTCGGGAWKAPSDGIASDVSNDGDITDSVPKTGPHFLWQITDVPSIGTTETGVIHRKSPLGNTDMVALFGKNTSTPAVGMVDIKDSSGVDHQVGVAILPGGYENPPSVSTTGCARRAKTAGTVYADRPVRTSVRLWAADCTKPVIGRGVAIVRLDNGELIRYFGRADEAPQKIITSVTDTPFDSPMVGQPVVFPDQVGVPIQKVFIGDADGTLWRIDLTTTDPTTWHANLFEDLIGAAAGASAPPSTSMPINVPPVLSTDDTGNLVINAATGDQESIVVSTDVNYVWSIREVRDTVSNNPLAQTDWWLPFQNSERVTGPMVVFDKVLYFASYLPQHPSSGVCTSLGTARLWGLDYVTANDPSNPQNGGVPKWCKATDVTSTGLCGGTPVTEEDQGSDIIPGVSLNASQACVTSTSDAYGNTAFSSITNTSYNLSFGIARPNPSGATPPQADRKTVKRPLPLTQTRIDSWSIVVD